jgi:hypothetical protein
MIRKGLRPSFRLALTFAAVNDGFCRVLPFKRNWIAIGALAAFDAAFLYPTIITFQQAVTGWGKFEDLFDLVSALFLSAWLLGWSIAPMIMTTLLAVLLFGREVVRTSPGKLEIFFGIPGMGVVAAYDVTRMRNLTHERPRKKSGKSWRGPHASFDYGANSGEFGSNLNEYDIAEIKSSLEFASGHTIRRGDAHPEDSQEEWGKAANLFDDSAQGEIDAVSAQVSEPIRLTSPSTILLIIANLVPVFGAAFLGWNLANVMVIYWAESAVVGFFNICKIIMIGRWFALVAAPFFLGHFGAFMAVHFLFLYGIFVQGPQDSTGGNLADVLALFIGLWPALVMLLISHGFSFVFNFLGRKEYAGRSVNKQMSEPYSRIIFMHLVLIIGGGLVLIMGEQTIVLVIVIALKIVMDIKAHIMQHQPAKKS